MADSERIVLTVAPGLRRLFEAEAKRYHVGVQQWIVFACMGKLSATTLKPSALDAGDGAEAEDGAQIGAEQPSGPVVVTDSRRKARNARLAEANRQPLPPAMPEAAG